VRRIGAALDQLFAKRRRIDVVVCWRLDRLGRNLKRLITLLEELQVRGVDFVTLALSRRSSTSARPAQDRLDRAPVLGPWSP
jgi:DNA invertase Pin-like site-specific DNA recombinase